MNIAVIAATEKEILPLIHYWQHCDKAIFKHCMLSFHAVGIGMLATSHYLHKIIQAEKPNFLLQIGIAGSFDKGIEMGESFVIQKEYLGDEGVWENGVFMDGFDMGFKLPNTPPFIQKALVNSELAPYIAAGFSVADGITVNTITTNVEKANFLKNKYQVQLESMEGAALHFVALQQGIPFVQIRGVSNYVTERNKANWSIPLAIENANKLAINLLPILANNTP